MARKKAEESMETVPSIEVLKDLEVSDKTDLAVDPTFTAQAGSEPPIPSRTSPEWSEWLMTQFHETELVTRKEERGGKQKDSKYPRVHGLRRLSQIFVGDIVESMAAQIQNANVFMGEGGLLGLTPTTCQYTIKFRKDTGEIVTYSDIGDCFWLSNEFSNQNKEFAVYPGPIAATRAEARCLRKALGLVTCSIEELGPQKRVNKEAKETVVNTDDDTEMKIQDNQINFLDVNCKSNRLNIHPLDLLKTINKSVIKLNEVTYQDAVSACKLVGELWRRKNNKEDSVTAYKKETKSEIRPYSQGWTQD